MVSYGKSITENGPEEHLHLRGRFDRPYVLPPTYFRYWLRRRVRDRPSDNLI
ncbi:unnamed protein product [Brassica oleracea]|uniref:(rape) hypothetical protein n=1 Tax=Brassica napus TaxID=3708 RepID=A0A816KLE9_BRANA|nr:unnamed protein product [Brassica napus]